MLTRGLFDRRCHWNTACESQLLPGLNKGAQFEGGGFRTPRLFLSLSTNVFKIGLQTNEKPHHLKKIRDKQNRTIF